jgi:hypothetical protein
MKPEGGHEGVWACARHDLFARVAPKETATALERGDPFTMHDGSEGVIVRHGDERQGGVLLYYRAK